EGSCEVTPCLVMPRESGASSKHRPEFHLRGPWLLDRPLARTMTNERSASPHVIAVARDGIDDRDLLDREVGDDFRAVLVHDQHLFDAHAPAEFLPVLGLEREHHAGLDLDRMIERPDA